MGRRGDSLLLPQDTRLSPRPWLPWLVAGDGSGALSPGVPSHEGCFSLSRTAHCQGNLVHKKNKQMPARWQCATCEELGLASPRPWFHADRCPSSGCAFPSTAPA